jgi:hypothetical protein
MFYKVQIYAKYKKIVLKFFDISVAFARMGIIFPVIMEITHITINRYFIIKLGMTGKK